MTKTVRNLVLSITAFALVSGVALKLFWDAYQFNRAMEQRPKVLALIDQIRLSPGSSQIEGKRASESVNEYAASVWRYYRSDASCLEVQRHYDSEASRHGFELESVDDRDGHRTVFHRKEQYEIRELFEVQTGTECNYALSVNWYGLDR